MLVRELFRSDVTRDISPVVYFHEQSAAKLAEEVTEYIITGGWPDDHPNHRRVPNGIHEQYVRLLQNICTELEKPGGPELPNVWISGFYGSGKSSFAKLLGVALNGGALPDGTSVAQAWLARDTSPRAQELHDAWRALRLKIEPMAVIFDVGAVARDNEHIHAAALRQVQERLGYCSTEPLVADFELNLERDGEWSRFETCAERVLGEPWAVVKRRKLAEEDFSLVMAELYPQRYTDPMSWFTSRAGTHTRSESPAEAVEAIRDMLRIRAPDATLFLVIDEVSQYVLSNQDRVERLRAFAENLGARLKGKAWLMALGQQKLEEKADASFLIKTKDRFPEKLRVHLATTNIRDVVHKRLLQKKSAVEPMLRELFESHRADLKLFAYGCEAVTPDEFVEVYPMLPGQIDLILQLTSALRTRSTRAQGDDQAIRGLLQLLGELFRSQRLADKPVGALVTLDDVYEVQHTALDSDVQDSMARIQHQCAGDADVLLLRVAKVVSLLELIQETLPTDARFVSQCLFDRIDRGNQLDDITAALEELRRRNLLGYSEKHGYKLQSTAGEEWERQRRDIGVPREAKNEVVSEALKWLLAIPERPRLQGRSFPWAGVFSDGRRLDDLVLVDPRDAAVMRVDFRYLSIQERRSTTWVKRSDETALQNRLVWVAGGGEQLDSLAAELQRSRAMVRKYKPRRESLNPARKLLLQQEDNRVEDLERRARQAVAAAWMAGTMYFRGGSFNPGEKGPVFSTALYEAARQVLPKLFPHFDATQLQPSDLLQLLQAELTGPSVKFLIPGLGILEMDSGRYVPACGGVVPRRVMAHIEAEGGLGGTTLLAHFGAPPYGYTTNVIKACVAGLLRGGKVRVQPEGADEITAVRDAGVRDVFDKDRPFRRATFFPAGEDNIGFQARARICKFFAERLHHQMDREDHAIADAVATHFPRQADALRQVQLRLNQLPGSPEGPKTLVDLGDVLERCIRSVRQTKPTVAMVKRNLDVLRDGVQLLQLYAAELTPAVIRSVNDAANVVRYEAAQLSEVAVMASNVEAATTRIVAQLQGDRPWNDIAALADDLAEVRAAYSHERTRILAWQSQQSEQVRLRLRGRAGFSTLTGEQSHRVLRPLSEALTNTTADAVAPSLLALKDPFLLALRRAEDRADEVLDEILSQARPDDEPQRLVQKVSLGLRNREVQTEAEVEALVGEIREKLMVHVRAGVRVRVT